MGDPNNELRYIQTVDLRTGEIVDKPIDHTLRNWADARVGNAGGGLTGGINEYLLAEPKDEDYIAMIEATDNDSDHDDDYAVNGHVNGYVNGHVNEDTPDAYTRIPSMYDHKNNLPAPIGSAAFVSIRNDITDVYTYIEQGEDVGVMFANLLIKILRCLPAGLFPLSSKDNLVDTIADNMDYVSDAMLGKWLLIVKRYFGCLTFIIDGIYIGAFDSESLGDILLVKDAADFDHDGLMSAVSLVSDDAIIKEGATCGYLMSTVESTYKRRVDRRRAAFIFCLVRHDLQPAADIIIPMLV